jgi:hypothetical protein
VLLAVLVSEVDDDADPLWRKRLRAPRPAAAMP